MFHVEVFCDICVLVVVPSPVPIDWTTKGVVTPVSNLRVVSIHRQYCWIPAELTSMFMNRLFVIIQIEVLVKLGY